MESLRSFLDAFWDENFWLPPNVTWHDVSPGAHGVNHANYRDLLWPIPLSILLILLRFVIERDVLKPVGRYLKIKDRRVSPPIRNDELEENYRKSNKLSNKRLIELSKKLEWSHRDIDRWWMKRRAQDKPTSLEKFCESSWKCLCYTCCSSLSLLVLWDKPYFWDILHCAYDYPHHEITDGVWYYYMISLSFYWSLTVMHFGDTKRKDFWQMFSHHVVTIMLISFSWVCNIHRVGSLIIAVHDCADVFLEAAKSFNYAKMSKYCDGMFAVFVIVWLTTRLGIYPRIMYATLFQTQQPRYPVYYFLNSLLIFIFILHIYWTYLIFQVINVKIVKGGCAEDSRSSSEECESSEDENENLKKNK